MTATLFDKMDLRKARLARLSHALHMRAGGVSAEEYAAICRDVHRAIDPRTDPEGSLREVRRRLRALDPSRPRPAAS